MQDSPVFRRALAALARISLAPPGQRHRSEQPEATHDEAWTIREGEERHRTLMEALDRAEAANDAKSRFLATVSHEIRTPLNGILGLAAVLQDTDLTAEQDNFVRAIRASGGLLLGLVDDMLDLARIEAGHLELEPEPTDPAALVQDVVELLAARAFARGIDIAAYVAPDVPAEIDIDGPRLRQVLANLIGNAIKFTDRGGVSVSVDLAHVKGGNACLAFAVVDSGSGMDAATVERLFDPGADLAGPVSRPFRGAGLGLPIAREIVRRLGGEIEVGARPAGGTVVSFSIPLDGTATPDAPAEPPAHAGRRCLVVAPDEIGAGIAARCLAETGVEARQVAAPPRAAALAAAASAAGLGYDFVLIDARATAAPGKALAAIREAAGARLPAAILMEPGNRKSVPALREAGFDAYLVRPLRRASLLRIAKLLLAPGGGFQLDPGDEKKATGRLAPSPGRSLNVLVVEDNEINALLLRAILERLGHRVEELHDGPSALAAVKRRNLDLVLLDLNLPGLDGAEIARSIRAHQWPPGVSRPVLVAVTGTASGRAEAIAAGFDGFLEKPVDPDALRGLLQSLSYPGAA